MNELASGVCVPCAHIMKGYSTEIRVSDMLPVLTNTSIYKLAKYTNITDDFK